MPRPPTGFRKALALLLGLVLVLTGCSAIPRSGPVQALQVENGSEGQGSTFSPPGPKVDANPREIIEGFIEAGIAPQDDYKVAREFLNPKQTRGVEGRRADPGLRRAPQRDPRLARPTRSPSSSRWWPRSTPTA